MSATPSSPVPSSTAPPSHSYTATNASTLLFGFLVSALSLFAVFMTFAVVWNRLIARRHAIEATLTSSPTAESPSNRRPTMRDIWIAPDFQFPRWLDIKPVAAQKYDCPPSSYRTTHTEQTTTFWRRMLNRLPPEITYLFCRPVPPEPFASGDTDASQINLSHGSDIQITLLITMPHAPQSTREGVHKNQHVFREMAFATTNVRHHTPDPS